MLFLGGDGHTTGDNGQKIKLHFRDWPSTWPVSNSKWEMEQLCQSLFNERLEKKPDTKPTQWWKPISVDIIFLKEEAKGKGESLATISVKFDRKALADLKMNPISKTTETHARPC